MSLLNGALTGKRNERGRMRLNEIIQGDALAVLKGLPDESVQCCVTSPPYWGLRDYGVDDQLGLEKTPEEYVARLVEILSGVKRVLKDDGTLWLNLGDSYATGGKQGHRRGERFGGFNGKLPPGNFKPPAGLKHKDLVGIPWMVAFALRADGWYLRSDIIWAKPNAMPESVIDRPTKAHEYIFLLSKRQKYYYDHAAIKERLSESTLKDGRMFDDSYENKRAQRDYPGHPGHGAGLIKRKADKQRGHVRRHEGFDDKWDNMSKAEQGALGRNKRSVWTVATHPFPEAHYATFPPALIKPCILAGSRLAGRRCDCDEIIHTPLGEGATNDPTLATGRAGMNRQRRSGEGRRPITRREQRGYAKQMKKSPHRSQMEEACGSAFAHYIRTDKSGARPLPPALLTDFMGRGWLTEAPPCLHPVEPADIVLDPFMGAGTTALVCEQLDRDWFGIELNPESIEIAKRRLAKHTEQHKLGLA